MTAESDSLLHTLHRKFGGGKLKKAEFHTVARSLPQGDEAEIRTGGESRLESKAFPSRNKIRDAIQHDAARSESRFFLQKWTQPRRNQIGIHELKTTGLMR